MKLRMLVALAIGGALLIGGCTTVVRTPGPTRVVYRDAPPPQPEVIPAAPAPGYYWVPGHWAWEGAWVWQRGHYVSTYVPPIPQPVREVITVAPSPAHVWVRGHYRWRGNGWLWISGRWVL